MSEPEILKQEVWDPERVRQVEDEKRRDRIQQDNDRQHEREIEEEQATQRHRP